MARRFKWDWDKTKANRFNPMDAGDHPNVDIAILQIIDSLRMFFTGEAGAKQMDHLEFGALLEVAAAAARRDD